MVNSSKTLSINNLKTLWNRFTQGSTNRQIFGAALIVGFCAISVKAVSFLKELVVAYTFGTGDALDAFLIAYLLPSFITSIVAESFATSLMPTYIHERDKKGPEAAQELFSGILVWGAGILILMTGALGLLGPYILPFLGSGFNAEKLALTERLFYFLLPMVIIYGLVVILSSILNAGERFFLAAVSPIAVPIITILAITLFASNFGVYTLVIGMIAGFGLQIFLLFLGVRKKGLSLRPKWTGASPAHRQVMNQYWPLLAGQAVHGSASMIDQAMASMLKSGSVAALTYGSKIPATVLGIGSMALGSAVLPYFSKMVANSDLQGINHTLRTYSLLILKVTIPITIIVYFFSESITQILFQRGAFTRADTVLVGQIQAMYILQLPFHLMGILVVRLISAIKYNKLLFYGSIFNVTLNIILNIIFMKYWGVAGIALSTAAVYLFSLLFLFAGLKKKLKRINHHYE